jgi:hypothetical protein
MDEATSGARLQHIVLFGFPRDLSPDEDAELRALVASFPSEIGTMTECRIGSDLTGERTRGYQYLLFTMFPSADALAKYSVHPVHQRLIKFLDDRSCTRLAFDYYVEG